MNKIGIGNHVNIDSKNPKEKMVNEKSWQEFRETGFLWWINVILHTFGWAIVYELHNEGEIRVYPARVRYQGFDDEDTTEGYRGK
jgi:hypothetical protein